MAAEALAGMGLVLLAGILSGASPAPLKAMRRYGFEHWSLLAAVCGQVALPWVAAWMLCPGLGAALGSVDPGALILANLLSAAWGVAAVLYGLSLVRIGFGLAVGLLTGIGLPIGVLLPLMLRGSGGFADAPGLASASGIAIAAGTLLMLVAVACFAGAGMRRDAGRSISSGSLRTGLAMAVGAGVLQAGLGLAFVYTQGPIGAALRAGGAGESGAGIGVWAVTLPGGAAVGIGYATWMLIRRGTWRIFASSPRDGMLALAMGVMFFLFLACLGAGMCRMGALGASIGFGLYQIAQLAAAQAVGLASGEWREAPRGAMRRLWSAIAIASLAVVVMAAGRWFAVAPAPAPAGAGTSSETTGVTMV
ncbi:MAG: hypothetical protein J0M02_09965 [Planctomycetes bacterium]|nr:hypothetical protein [Planctomycetota bacterium]